MHAAPVREARRVWQRRHGAPERPAGRASPAAGTTNAGTKGMPLVPVLVAALSVAIFVLTLRLGRERDRARSAPGSLVSRAS